MGNVSRLSHAHAIRRVASSPDRFFVSSRHVLFQHHTPSPLTLSTARFSQLCFHCIAPLHLLIRRKLEHKLILHRTQHHSIIIIQTPHPNIDETEG